MSLPMNRQETPTKVVFRKYPNGDILALFPEIPHNHLLCSSYQHLGQHGPAHYSLCIRSTKPASPQEYQSLKEELEAAPYHYSLKVIKRYQPSY